ncbi:MAG: pseudouridine synthase [Pseudomonadota bacterium]
MATSTVVRIVDASAKPFTPRVEAWRSSNGTAADLVSAMPDSTPLQRHVVVEDADRSCVDLLSEDSGLSRSTVKDAMNKGAVWITRGRKTQRLRRVKRRLRAGDELHLYFDANVLAETAVEPELVDDGSCFSVWNKPYGLRSQGSKWGDHCTVVRCAERRLDRSALTVHRLDRAASGLMVLAHGRQSAAELSRQFREREVTKRYRVRVHGTFPEESVFVDTPLDGKTANSRFRRVTINGELSLVDVRIETGRKHQVRRHLAELGFPVVGDRLYGRGHDGEPDLQLKAVELGFRHPQTGDALTYCLEDSSWAN